MSDTVEENSTEPRTEHTADADGTETVGAGAAAEGAETSGASGADTARPRVRHLEEEGEIAADYLEELLDIADLDGDIDMDVEGDRAAVSVVGSDLDRLVGPSGEVLERLQELTRLAVYRETGQRSGLMLDVGGYRAEVKKNVLLMAQEAMEDVRESGESVKLSPMNPFERKVVHDAVAAAGLSSSSEGEEPTRCVVISPAEGSA